MKLQVDKLAEALQGIETNHQLSKDIVEEALIEALTKAYRKHINVPDAYVKVEIKDGAIHIFQQRMVVEEVQDDELELQYDEIKDKYPLAQIGDMINEEVNFTDFDRAAVVLAKNVMKQKLREAEKQQVYEEYCDKVDEMVTGVVSSVEEKFILVDIGKTLAMMRKADQIPTEVYKEGQLLPVVITNVNKESKGAQVLCSRATPVFVKRLFEREVPEIYNGIIEIKAIAREPGERCKLAVTSKNENIDPIGACIGPRGSRVQTIINELKGEKIDIFQWSDDLQQLISNALSPAEGIAVIPNDAVKDGLIVVVPDNQLSLAIGKKGKNARLAVKLSGHKIDIKSQSEMDAQGIDYMGIAEKMHQDYLDKKAAERAYKQQLKIEEANAGDQEIEDINVADFTYEEPESNDLSMPNTETLYDREQEAASAVGAGEESKKELDEMEEAARIAREKRKEKSLHDVSEYTSKFESILSPVKPEPAAPAKKKEEPKKEEEKKEKKPPVFNTMKPIYSEEELAQIEEEEEDDEYDMWDEDIDYEDFDSYYDD